MINKREDPLLSVQIAPSILACDFSRLGEECIGMERAGADLLHVDVMDGHFVPNLTFGPAVVASLRPLVRLPIDVHLMVTDPAQFAGAFVSCGADIITFHVETQEDCRPLLARIHAEGIKAGLVLRPATPVQALLPYLDLVDVVMVMTVEPGFGGQKLIDDTLQKIVQLRACARTVGRANLCIEADGGITADTAARVVRAGANRLVAGSALFSAPDYPQAVKALRQSAAAGFIERK